MRSDFRRVTFDEAVELILDHRGRTPKKLGGDFTDHGVQVISAKNVYGHRLHADESRRFVSPEMALRWMPNPLKSGDVLLTSEAPLGQAAYLNGSANFCLGQRLFGLRARPGVANGRFLYYALISPTVQARLHARASGTTAQGIKQSELRQVELDLPTLPEQERIASVLAALDDKIDSNRRLAMLLEQIAQTEFEARFVDFVGVEDVEDTELGPLPPGWRVGKLADFADLHKEQVRPAEAPGAEFEHFSIAAFDAGNGPAIEPGEAMLSAKTTVPGPDCVLVSKLNPGAKRVWWPHPRNADAAVCSPEFLVLMPRTGIPTSYLYAVTSSDRRFYEEFLAHVTGTTGSRQRVKPAAAMSCRVVVPTTPALDSWDSFAKPLYDHAHGLAAESRRLGGIRDTLLPKLISGQIRLSDTAEPGAVIEPLVDEAA